MEKFQLTFLLFFASTICLAHASSFKCYACAGKDGEEYTTDTCEKEQKEVTCNSTQYMPKPACMISSGEMEDGKKTVARGCMDQSFCTTMEKTCGDDDLKKAAKIAECAIACCESDLCNNAFTVSTNMLMLMFAVLCSALLF